VPFFHPLPLESPKAPIFQSRKRVSCYGFLISNVTNVDAVLTRRRNAHLTFCLIKRIENRVGFIMFQSDASAGDVCKYINYTVYCFIIVI
jgi:hypothetical protein